MLTLPKSIQTFSQMASSRYANRFEPLTEGWEVQRGKRARHSTGGASCHDIHTPPTYPIRTPPARSEVDFESHANMDELKKLPVDEKLNVLMEGISNIGLIKCRIDRIESDMYISCASHEVTNERLKLLEYKSIDMESRARETNLIISGVSESVTENCVDTVLDIFTNTMGVDTTTFNIVAAHRLGRVFKPQYPSQRPRHRLMLVILRHRLQVNNVFRFAYKLKNTSVSLTRDYPREISDARKVLWPRFKAERAKYGPKEVQIIYPAALKVNGTTVENMFPGWHDVLNGSRHTDASKRVGDAAKRNAESVWKIYEERKSREFHQSATSARQSTPTRPPGEDNPPIVTSPIVIHGTEDVNNVSMPDHQTASNVPPPSHPPRPSAKNATTTQRDTSTREPSVSAHNPNHRSASSSPKSPRGKGPLPSKRTGSHPSPVTMDRQYSAVVLEPPTSPIDYTQRDPMA